MTAPSFVASDQPVFGANGRKSIVGVLTVPTSGAGGVAVSAGPGNTFRQLKGLKRVEFLDGRFSMAGHLPSFSESDLKVHGWTATAGPITDLFNDVLGGVFANHLTDQASAGVESAAIHAAIAGNDATFGGAGTTTGLTQPPVEGRNLNIEISSVGGATATAANVIVTGTFSDGSTTETIAIPTGAVAAGKFRNRVGTKVCLTVTKIQLSVAQPADILVSVGLGTKVGLRAALRTPASGDVLAVKKNTAAVASSTYVVDTTANAVDLGADLADNDDLVIEYQAKAGEAAASTNLGTVRVRAVGW